MARQVLFDPSDWERFVDQRQRFDYQLLLRGFVCRVEDSQSLHRAAQILQGLGYLVHRLDASHWHTERDLHDALTAELSFPGYYGRNLDALNDALSDVAEFAYGADPESTGTAILIDGYDRLGEISPRLARSVADIFAAQARYAAVLGHPFLCILRTDADLGQIGGTRVLPETVPPVP